MGINDEKIQKLNERMDQPLPSYDQSQIIRTRKVDLSTLNQSESPQKDFPQPKFSMMGNNLSIMEKSQKLEKDFIMRKLSKEN